MTNKSRTVVNSNRYAGEPAVGSHVLAYCQWSGIKVAVSNLYHQFPLISKNWLAVDHPVLAVPLDTWQRQWERLSLQGSPTEKYLAIISVLKQLNILKLGKEPCSPVSGPLLDNCMDMIAGDIFPNLRFIKARILPTAFTNRQLSLEALLTGVVTSLNKMPNPHSRLQWEEDLDRTVSKLMREVTGGKLKPSQLAQWATEMLKAYGNKVSARDIELVVNCIMQQYRKITTDQYMRAIEILRTNLPVSVVDITTASVSRSIQSSTVIQYITEKLAMLQPEIDMFSLLDPDAAEATDTKPAAPAQTSTGKQIVIDSALAFDAAAYANFPMLQPSGLPYPSEMHRKIAFNKQQKALALAAAAAVSDTKSSS